MTKNPKAQAKLERQLREAKKAAGELGASRDQHASDLKAALDLLRAQGKEIGELSNAVNYFREMANRKIEENPQLKQAVTVSAAGMAIERDELVARASRLTMRIQGLGAIVQ